MAIQEKPVARLVGWQLALDRAPQFLSVILLFAVPFVTQPQGFDPLLPKSTMLQALVFLMVGLWALRVYATGRLVIMRSSALWVLGFLVLWLVMLLPITPYSKASLLGFRDLWPYLLWYVLLTFTCTEAWRTENLLVVFLASGLGTSLWAVGQSLGLADGAWLSIAREKFGGRPLAGMGDPDSLAGHLLLVWPMGLALMVRAANLPAKVLWGLVVVSSLVALFLTGSGSGWTGSVAGAAVFAWVLLKAKGRKTLPWVVGICVFLTACFFLPPLQERLRSIGNTGPGSIQFRQQVWSGTLKIIKDHPLEGTGYGTFWAAFPSYRPYPLSMNEGIGEGTILHVKNWVLEWTVESGFLGLLLLLAFWYFVVRQWWKLHAAHAIPPSLTAGFFAAVTGAAVDNLFNGNNYLPSTLVPLFFLASMPVALSQRFTRIPGYPIQMKVVDLSKYRIYLLPVLALVAAGCLAQVKNAFVRQGADALLGRALRSAADSQWAEALPLLDRALRFDPVDIAALYSRARVELELKGPGDKEKALADLELVQKVAPGYRRLHWHKFQVLSLMGRSQDASEELKKAVQMEPRSVERTEGFQKARKLMVQRKPYEAMAIYLQLVLDYPSCVPLMVDYAKCLAAVGKTLDAKTVLGEALKLDPGNQDANEEMKKVTEKN